MLFLNIFLLNSYIRVKIFKNGPSKICGRQPLKTVCMFLSCHVGVSELWLHECQGTPCSKQARDLRFKWLQRELQSFPMILIEWNKLDLHIRNSQSFSSFIVNISKYIPSSKNIVFLWNNPKRIQLWTKLRLVSRHLRKHKFKHNFQETLNPICNWSEDIEISCRDLLHCSLYTSERLKFEDKFKTFILVF